MKLSRNQITAFQQTIWRFYGAHARTMPWRSQPTPYHVVVSEIMLQQTQVSRVVPKFLEFTALFPDFNALAAAPLSGVLTRWSGLGYNRRAKYLHEAAKTVVNHYGGHLPDAGQELAKLPGIGPNTAGAIVAYAFNQPVVFIETNIRTVIIHHFFTQRAQLVTDTQIRRVAQQVLPPENTRQWYWALMDYGAHIKTTAGSQLHKVYGYRTQSTFHGSRRQIRGQVVRTLAGGARTFGQLQASVADNRLMEVLLMLQKEGLVAKLGEHWHLTGYSTPS